MRPWGFESPLSQKPSPRGATSQHRTSPVMKTEFVDVSETRKNLVVEIDSSTVDAEIDRVARDYSKAARIPGLPPGQGAGAGRQAAVPQPDSARRRARAGAARRGRRAARARRRAARHARHPRRRRRRRPAAEVHGHVRHGAELRAAAVHARCSCAGRRPTLQEGAVDETLQALRERAARLRGGRGAAGRARRHRGRRPRARGRRRRRRTRTRTSPSRSAPPPIRRASTTR